MSLSVCIIRISVGFCLCIPGAVHYKGHTVLQYTIPYYSARDWAICTCTQQSDCAVYVLLALTRLGIFLLFLSLCSGSFCHTENSVNVSSGYFRRVQAPGRYIVCALGESRKSRFVDQARRVKYKIRFELDARPGVFIIAGKLIQSMGYLGNARTNVWFYGLRSCKLFYTIQ